jgi:N-acetylmuramoyl-L-alanine amidase
MFALCLQHALAAAPEFAVGISTRGDQTRVTVALPQPAKFAATVDAATRRVDIDFDGPAPLASARAARGGGIVRSYRIERRSGGPRLRLDLVRPAIITGARALPAVHGRPAQVVIDLAASTVAAMRAASGVIRSPAALSSAPPATTNDAIARLIDRPEQHILTLPAKVAASRKPLRAPMAQTQPQSVLDAPHVSQAAVLPINDIAIPVPTGSRSPALKATGAKRTIVIDAGHGGIDPGADSVAGFHEKEVTLAAARALRRALEQTGRYNVMLTRDGDAYLKLRERVARARAAHGDMFISLHADSAPGGSSSARGASIYTLSQTASDAESERLAQRENRADAIGGVDLGSQRDDVAGILVDLTMRETVNDGNRLADFMVESFRHDGIGVLPAEPHRSAGFAVLKSPDIPSVLIEMGYLSDMSDARGLADPRHQQQVARAIADGVDRYFAWAQAARS